MLDKSYRWLDLNPGPMESEATALSNDHYGCHLCPTFKVVVYYYIHCQSAK